MNNTRKAGINILFFNRCAKVGSESLLELIQKLENLNEFNIDTDGLSKGAQFKMTNLEQKELAHHIVNLGEGAVHIEHVNWIDFDKFDLPMPIYINLVRDPVERVISWFYYVRSSYRNAIYYRQRPNHPIQHPSWYKKDFNHCVRSGDPECQYVPYTVQDNVGNYKRQTLFFCGHHDDCLPFNSPTAVHIAKQRVERYYAVVGSWEDTNITLNVFEKYIPRFFRGAKLLFEIHNEKLTNRNKNNLKPKVDEDVKAMIRKNFTHEYDFYYFCKQRLYKQYLALNLKDVSSS